MQNTLLAMTIFFCCDGKEKSDSNNNIDCEENDVVDNNNDSGI